MIDADKFKQAMRRTASGVSVITTRHDGCDYGIVATSISSLSIDPPSIIACIGIEASIHRPALQSKRLCVSILSQDMITFIRSFTDPNRRKTRFEGEDWIRVACGILALKEASLVIECTLAHTFPCYTHTIVAAAINTIHINPKTTAPLIHFDGEYRHL